MFIELLLMCQVPCEALGIQQQTDKLLAPLDVTTSRTVEVERPDNEHTNTAQLLASVFAFFSYLVP